MKIGSGEDLGINNNNGDGISDEFTERRGRVLEKRKERREATSGTGSNPKKKI